MEVKIHSIRHKQVALIVGVNLPSGLPGQVSLCLYLQMQGPPATNMEGGGPPGEGRF